MRLLSALGWTALLLAGVASPAAETKLKSDEQLLFYPSVAQRVPGLTNVWRTTIRGCVFEPEKRRALIALFREALELKTEEMSAAESAIFADRARLFLVDHERGKKIYLRCGASEFFVGKSGADGRFAREILLSEADLQSAARGAAPFSETDPRFGEPFQVALVSADQRPCSGAVFPLGAAGVSVVSDIDDTIKITEVRNRKATLRNTFLREFQPVPGMAEFYQALARSNHATFHYVSASPWQLYEPLAAFVVSNRFPAGTFELKQFRWKDRSFFSLFANPEKQKRAVIEPLVARFRGRQFIFIGDSGERDPEIYGAIARKFPAQVLKIYIRDVTGDSASDQRFAAAFHDVARERWQIFRHPEELRLPPPAPEKPD